MTRHNLWFLANGKEGLQDKITMFIQQFNRAGIFNLSVYASDFRIEKKSILVYREMSSTTQFDKYLVRFADDELWFVVVPLQFYILYSLFVHWNMFIV